MYSAAKTIIGWGSSNFQECFSKDLQHHRCCRYFLLSHTAVGLFFLTSLSFSDKLSLNKSFILGQKSLERRFYAKCQRESPFGTD